MRGRRWLLVAAWLAAASAQADDFRFLGSFDDVRSSDGGEHCSGHSLALWRDGGRLLGLFDVHQGLCGDPPCAAIGDAALDPATGTLRFSALVHGEAFTFAGQMTPAGVAGRLNGAPLQLAPDSSGAHDDNPGDRSFADWCGFWRTVNRCTGVQDLCGAAGARSR